MSQKPSAAIEMDEVESEVSGSGTYSYATISRESMCQLNQDNLYEQEHSYWQPSDKESELKEELKLLKLKFFEEHELE